MELIGFDELSSLLLLSQTEADYPDLEIIKNSVSQAFEVYTGRVFDEDTYKDTVILGDLYTKMIPLNALPVSSVVQVLVSGQETMDYQITCFGIRLGAKLKNNEVSVSYTGGLESVPKALERAALLQTVYEYQNKDSIGIEVVNTTGGSVVKPELGLLKEVKKLLNSVMHPFPKF